MISKPDQGPLWPSYADLMTSLFCVTLVLFVLSHWLLTVKYKMSAQKWERVQEVEESVKKLADEKYFIYQKDYKRHVFRRDVQFERGKSIIPQEEYAFLGDAGRRISSLIEELQRKSGANIKYLIIIEGMASDDKYPNNFELSYQRALALFRLWKDQHVKFDSNICEVIIAGSGIGGVGRYGPADEKKNQRFLIQILPKVGAEGWGARPDAGQAATSRPIAR